jgi:2,3-dihydroxy-p-cumate/2,3-dihydroxybenzoate 3,4-dioxygenase
MIRYRKLGYVALNVSNIEKSKEFYTKMVGLESVSAKENEPVFLRCTSDHHNVILYQTDREPGLKRIGFELESDEQIEIAFKHFQEHGLEPYYIDESEQNLLKQTKTFRFTEPYSGATLEFYNDQYHLPHEFKNEITKFETLSHVVIKVPEYEKAVKFYREVMNFKVSDMVGNGITFMRCFPNPYHHSVAVANGTKPQLHHVAFKVVDINDIGIGRMRIANNDVPIVHGPGRHLPSGSIFLYFLDPDNLTLEFTMGMEAFPEEDPRKPRYLQPHIESIDIWGTVPDPRKAAFGSVENLKEINSVVKN